MPDLNEAREAEWRAWWELVVGDDEPGEDTHDPHFNFMGGWDARGRYDEQRIAELDKRALLREWRSGKYALWRDDPAAIAGFSAGVDAVLRALAGQSEEVTG